MFRKPREQVEEDQKRPLIPSIGRPPTPPSSTKPKDFTNEAHNSLMATSRPLSLSGRSQTLPKPTSRSSNSIGKNKGSSNGSILNFFKKTDSPLKHNPSVKDNEESLFFYDDRDGQNSPPPVQTATPPQEDKTFFLAKDLETSIVVPQFNESNRPAKRRRVDDCTTNLSSLNVDSERSSKSFDESDEDPGGNNKGSIGTNQPDRDIVRDTVLSATSDEDNNPSAGPFMEDHEGEDEMMLHLSKAAFGTSSPVPPRPYMDTGAISKNEDSPKVGDNDWTAPSLKREATSMNGGDDFDGIEDFIDDEFAEDGEEYLERRWMDEQEQLDLLSGDEEDGVESATRTYSTEDSRAEGETHQAAKSGSCPICNTAFVGISDEEASIHVNHCLDGKPIPLPKPTIPVEPDPRNLQNGSSSHKRFQRAAIARPGQDNPFSLGSKKFNESTAFSKLMSSHAEDVAWATAAASETASRGKPAYQRTCPFYKILPGFFICVDAFRYGAVEGCKAYFLSHFHSDHYIGLTSSWCHGPIYCSHVTANLVRRQLRVDPKWVIDLEFDHKVEVPRSQGVEVTMIPANHCPGSSLFLFEKIIGKGKTPKVQRVLHCGDFRACPAHVQHPLLRPDVIDTLTGKYTGQQKLDVCYLDTTYLTPKYAFPNQEEVIKACADMCVSLSKERVDENDSWEQAKKDRAGSGMTKFVRTNSETVKEEDDDNVIDIDKADTKVGQKARGRLLVIVGTYSIGKERICLGVARALDSKIYAPPNKQKICAALEDPELIARLTNDPLEAQVHMQMLMEIRAETLADYLTGFKPHFSRIVGFRPSGWNYRPPNSRFVESPAVQTVLYSDNWKSKYSMSELVPQRGSTREASCFGVPYSEHSSFRELTMFCCALRIDKIIPTVNVGSAKSREKMKMWCEKWAMEKKKNGLYKVQDGQTAW